MPFTCQKSVKSLLIEPEGLCLKRTVQRRGHNRHLEAVLGHVGEDGSRGAGADAAGFEEVDARAKAWGGVARALVTDRVALLVPAWVCVMILVLATALIRGLASRGAGDGSLPHPSLLLLPHMHLHLPQVCGALRVLGEWLAMGQTTRGVGGSLVTVTRGLLGLAMLLALTDALDMLAPPPWTLEVLGGDGASPGGLSSALGRWAMALWGSARAVRQGLAWALSPLNPFVGAKAVLGPAPVKMIVSLYLTVLGMMLALLGVATMTGLIGNAVLKVLEGVKFPSALKRFTNRYWVHVAMPLLVVVVVAVHLERLRPTLRFRALSLEGELSLMVLTLSAALYALLASFLLFPSSRPDAAAHQHLLLLLYAPLTALLSGVQILAVRVISGAGRGLNPQGGDDVMPWGALGMAVILLAPLCTSAFLARRARPFPSPPTIRGLMDQLRDQWQAEVRKAMAN
ncbi:unnamed protein product, partial [Discosporangium mesarthrocarpum]